MCLVNKSKDKGTKAESDVVKLFREEGYPFVERRALQGTLDKGDISGIRGVVIEVKAEAKASFNKYQEEALIEAKNDGGSLPIVVWKKPYKNVKQWVAQIPLKVLMGEMPLKGFDPDVPLIWVSMDLIDMIWYLKELGY